MRAREDVAECLVRRRIASRVAAIGFVLRVF